jgi:hypothetical protein
MPMRTLIILHFFCFPLTMQAQPSSNRDKFVLSISRTSSPVKIDGHPEAAWENVESTSEFLNKWPVDSGFAEARTDVKMMYDDAFIYVLAVNYQMKHDIIIQTLKRDQLIPFWNSDGFSVIFDPLGQRTSGFLFGVNAGGAQLEGAISLKGPSVEINENWDNKWFSAVTISDTCWVAEMAIPFAALRFENGNPEWAVNFIRNDMKRNHFSTWAKVPLQFHGADLGYTGTLQWKGKVTPIRSRVTLIPFVSTSQSKNHEDNEKAKAKLNAGMDAKISVTSSLNLDLTLRPDFSNVEVDRQVTNVSRYSLLFPERRNFFLENADLFTNFGSWLVRPFFSRKIGLYDGDPIPIQAGARLSGNVTRGLRVGMMDVQTEATPEFSAQNYFVASFQQRVLDRSSVKFLATNRQTTKHVEGDVDQDYNRTYGGEFKYTSSNGNFNAHARTHVSVNPGGLKENRYHSVQAGYLNSKFYAGGLIEQVGENYVNSVGFIPRLYNYDATRDTTVRIGHYNFNHWFGLMLYPKHSRLINMIEPNTWGVINYRTSGEFLESMVSVNTTLYFKNTALLFVDASNTHVHLPFPADILDNDKPIPVAFYAFTQYTVKFTSDARKVLNAEASVTTGRFYNGTRTEYGLTLNARKQPWGTFGVTYIQNNIHLPGEYGSAAFKLIGPMAEISLTSSMWLTTFLQYNTQAENFNINSRFQWRFKPMSDLFLVYSDNYTTTDLKVKNRGVVLKITYWLNM